MAQPSNPFPKPFLYGSPLRPIWLYLVPLFSPVLMAPMSLPLLVLSPSHWIYVLVLTGLLHWSIWAASIWVVLVVADAVWMATPSRGWGSGKRSGWTQVWGAPGARASRIVYDVVFVIAFLTGLVMMPSFQPVLRWFACFGFSYYAASAVASYVVMAAAPPSPFEMWEKTQGRSLTER